jgi:hypothetical protein
MEVFVTTTMPKKFCMVNVVAYEIQAHMPEAVVGAATTRDRTSRNGQKQAQRANALA